jgi:hypothetical protein
MPECQFVINIAVGRITGMPFLIEFTLKVKENHFTLNST